MKYTIKEISDLLAVTTHKLRYYEKNGIIEPEVNESTGYRYYSVIDTRRFNLARLYRGMGFTVDECLKLLGNVSSEQIIEDIDMQKENLKKEVKFKKLCINEMENYANFLKKMPELMDCVAEIELEDYIRVEFSDNEKITKDQTIIERRDAILEYTPLIRWVSRIPRKTLGKQSGFLKYHYGVNMSLRNAKKLGINCARYDIIPGGKYLITVFKKNESPTFGWETLSMIQDYLSTHDISNYGDGLSSCIHSNQSDGKYFNYHYLMVKID